jgi:hypothetical protein
MSYPNNPQVPQPVYAPQQPTYAPPPQQQPQGRYVPERRGRALSTGHVNAISWKEAQPGDTYEGFFLRLERSSFAPYNHGIVLETGDGTEILLRGTGRLQNFLRNHRPQPGQYFVFTMLGKEKITKGKFAGNSINEFDIQIIDDMDKSKDERFINLAVSVNREYDLIAQASAPQQPQQMPYGQQAYAQPPPQYVQPQYAPQPAYAPQQYAPQPAYAPQPPAPVYAPQPAYAPQQPAPVYAPQPPQQQPQPAYVPPYNPNDVPF